MLIVKDAKALLEKNTCGIEWNDNSNNNINEEITYFEYMSGLDIYSGYVIFYKKTVIFTLCVFNCYFMLFFM